MRVRTLSSGFFCSSILTLGISGLTLSQGHAPALVAALGIVAVGAVPTVIALALCRAAAAGDRAVIDGEQRAAVRVGPELRIVLALVVALLAAMAAPARATVDRSTRRRIPARHIPSACPDTALQPNQGNISLIRAAVLCLVNRERADRGERPLVPDARLQRAAQAHSESMAFHNYFEHDGPQRETPLSRIRATGYISSARIGYEVGENIAWGTLWEGAPSAIVAAWMASPGHRANILDARFRDSAVGVSPHLPSSLAGGQAGAIYTEDFGDLR